jgi:dTMP kinase
MRGKLITLEGIDGAGKTTHARLLAEWLQQRGEPVLCLREPGGTELGEALRALLKQGTAKSAHAELLLFAAARAELVELRLRPELAAGRTVLLDRFTDSTLTYQGALGLIDEESLQAVCRVASGGLVPDMTIWLDISPSTAFGRFCSEPQLAEAGRDTIEKRGLEYFNVVRARYQQIAEAEPERVWRIDADDEIDVVQQQLRAAVEKTLME